MRYIMRRSCLFLVMIAVIVFTGCGQKKKEDPVTVTLWHVYGGQTESPLNDLIDEFNETIGKEDSRLLFVACGADQQINVEESV